MSLFSNIFLENLTSAWTAQKVTESTTAPSTTPITVPLTSSATNSSNAKLTEEGNVPLTSETKVSQEAPIKGLSIEKSTQTEAPKAQEKTEVKEEFKKTGESVDERLARFYGKKYENATAEEKEKYLEKYLTGYFKEIKGKSKEEQIKLQLADFKKLLSNTRNGDSYEMMAKKISILEEKNQLLAAKRATVEEKSDELRNRGEIGVAKTIHNCHENNQTALTKLIVDSKNEAAIKIGASYASKLAVSNQVQAVEIYQKTQMAESFQKELDKILINQYGKFAKQNEVDIHKIMSASKISETVEYAASNIHKFDKENQVKAFAVTSQTGNEKAVQAALAQADKYDASVKQEINAIAQAQISQAKPEVQKEEVKVSPTKTEEAQTKTNSKTSTYEQYKEISKTIATSSDMKTIRKALEGASDSVKIALLSSLSTDKLAKIIPIILESNPSSIVRAKINSVINNANRSEAKKLISEVSNTNFYKTLQSDTSALSFTVQQELVEKSATSGDLRNINSLYLSAPIKKRFDELKDKNKLG